VDHQKQGLGTKIHPENKMGLLGGVRVKCDETMDLCVAREQTGTTYNKMRTLILTV
jgi:hypothetical protein